MRFPYLELAAKVEKFVERKPVEKAALVAVPAPSPAPKPVAVQSPQAAAVEPVPPKKPPVAVEVKLLLF
jgi:hypothetical protein